MLPVGGLLRAAAGGYSAAPPDQHRTSRGSLAAEIALRYPPVEPVRRRLLSTDTAPHDDRSIRQRPAGCSPADQAADAARRFTVMPM
jgi:hypothetical protein